MADFNPELGISPTSIQDQTGASRGIPTNRAWETLFSGLGDVAKGAAQTVDVNVQQNIRTDVEQFQDQLNQRMGYGTQASGDQALSTDSVFGGNTAANTNPKELQAAKDRMALLTAAHNQGRLTQSMYWDRMTTFAKSLRSQYPGYNQQIDNIIDDVTGRNSPENRLRSELDQQYDKQTSNLQAANKALDTQLYQNAEWITQVNPGFFSPENFNKATTAEKQKVLSQGFELQARDQKLKSDNLQIENEKNTTENKKMKQKDWINQSMNLIAYKSMSQMTSGAGVTGTDLSKKIQQAMINPMSDKDLLSAQTAMQQRKILVMQEMDKLRLTEAGRSMSKSEFDDAKSLAMSDIDFYFDLLNNKETGLMAASANATKLATDRELNSLIEASPLTKRAIAIGKVSPDLARSFILGHNTDLLKATDIIAGPATAVGDLKVDDFVKSVMTDKKVTSAEQSQIVTHYTKLFADTFSKKEVSDQNVADMIKTNFDKNGFAELFSTVNASDRYKLYSTLTSPNVTDRISKLADPQAKAMYLDWAKTQFKAIPDVLLAAGNIDTANASNPESVVQFKYNPQTFTFSTVPQPATQFGLDPAIRADQDAAAQQMLAKFNADLSNLGYAMKKLGQDPNVEIPKILNDLHVQMRQQGKQSNVPGLQKAVIGSLMPAGGQTPGFTPGDENLHLAQGESANPFIQSTAKNLLDYVSTPESRGNYNAIINNVNSTYDLSQLTVDGILDLQKELVKAGNESGAVGKFQIIGPTLRSLKTKLGLSGEERFTPELQDKLGMALLVGRGYKDWTAGKISDNQFATELSKEWAALPDPNTGKSYYTGVGKNAAGVSTEDVMKALSESRNDIPGGSGKDLLGFGGGTDIDRFPGGQTFAEKDHIVSELPGPGTFDANQFRESDIPTEDRRGNDLENLTPIQEKSRKKSLDLEMVKSALRNSFNHSDTEYSKSVDAFIKKIEADPQAARNLGGYTLDEIFNDMSAAESILNKADKKQFEKAIDRWGLNIKKKEKPIVKQQERLP